MRTDEEHIMDNLFIHIDRTADLTAQDGTSWTGTSWTGTSWT